jgi:hypothetical protein
MGNASGAEGCRKVQPLALGSLALALRTLPDRFWKHLRADVGEPIPSNAHYSIS